eukprot:365202-Chlamydomonas_euryale.AAC.8
MFPRGFAAASRLTCSRPRAIASACKRAARLSAASAAYRRAASAADSDVRTTAARAASASRRSAAASSAAAAAAASRSAVTAASSRRSSASSAAARDAAADASSRACAAAARSLTTAASASAAAASACARACSAAARAPASLPRRASASAARVAASSARAAAAATSCAAASDSCAKRASASAAAAWRRTSSSATSSAHRPRSIDTSARSSSSCLREAASLRCSKPHSLLLLLQRQRRRRRRGGAGTAPAAAAVCGRVRLVIVCLAPLVVLQRVVRAVIVALLLSQLHLLHHERVPAARPRASLHVRDIRAGPHLWCTCNTRIATLLCAHSRAWASGHFGLRVEGVSCKPCDAWHACRTQTHDVQCPHRTLRMFRTSQTRNSLEDVAGRAAQPQRVALANTQGAAFGHTCGVDPRPIRARVLHKPCQLALRDPRRIEMG